LHQADQCNISLIEYELELDKYTVMAIAKNLESKGFIELVTPQLIKMKHLGEEYIKEHIGELIIIDTAIKKLSEVINEMPELRVYNKVFIIHGHDELNLLILEKLLKERWQLSPIILRQLPGKGRTMIEKFEEEAKMARYAFAIYTPDDFIEIKDTEYCQARPNTIFELGWFYGNKGRD
jgi:predicted nucleotide-binding protein